MPPIPVHIDAPITPSKATGVTPQTAEDAAAAAPVSGPTTTSQSGQPSYPAARPGAAAVPAPTPYAPPQPTRTQPLTTEQNGPSPPQPGAVPVPSLQQTPLTATSSNLPPPPKAGEAAQSTTFTGVPSQMHVPPPSQNQAPTHSTSTYQPPAPPTTTTRNGPTTLNMGPVASQYQEPASHPPGYQQNLFAQEMTPAQRASLDQQRAVERRGSLGGGILSSDGTDDDGVGNGVAGVWGAVKGWASTAGTKAAEVEGEVWKRINGQ